MFKFLETLQLARRTRRMIMTNFGGTLVVDGIGIAPVMYRLDVIATEIVNVRN